MKQWLIEQWSQFETRERWVLVGGSALVLLILFYAFLLQPLYAAIDHMEKTLPVKRVDLVWMRQQAEMLQNGGVRSNTKQVKGAEQSLLSILEQTAKTHNVRKAITQMVPGQSDQQVSVVLEEANFNQWVKWIDVLFQQYAVSIKQLTAEKSSDEPNEAEIRVTFERI